MTQIEATAPRTLADANLHPRGAVFPSPVDWRDQTLYFLLPDRFSDGGEAQRPAYAPGQFQAADHAAWMAGGRRFQGGTLKGIQSKLEYLRDLGVTALWIGPIWKQRADLETYHGYGIQNFLDVDPRFGTRQDLRDLVDAAHARGIYVLLDIILNHTGNNWYYNSDGHPWETMPYRYSPPYDFHSWRSQFGIPVQTPESIEDGVWPQEFQDIHWYTRAGQILQWDAAGWEDPLHPEVQFRRGDFFDLKDLNLERSDVVEALIKVYRYWIALSDCDGFRIDTVKHIPWESSRRFCTAIHEYAESIGKENFWLLGEVTGGPYMARSYLELTGRNLDAILDIGHPRTVLTALAKGFAAPVAFFDQFAPHDVLGGHRETGHYHVSILDDHDMVGAGEKRRFAAGSTSPQQVAHATALMLTTLGVPCIYYGTEQAFDGGQHQHDFSVEAHLSHEDRYVREAMFGGTFGAFGTQGCHFFDSAHPVYSAIAEIARVRNRRDLIGLALRRGHQSLRETASADRSWAVPGAGEVMAWARGMVDTEVLLAFNTHGLEAREAWIEVNPARHPEGSALTLLYGGSGTVPIQPHDGRPAVFVALPPSGFVVLTLV